MTSTVFIKTGAAVELGLMVGESTGLFGSFLPLTGSHGTQLGIIFGGAWWAHEAWDLTTGLRMWLRSTLARRDQ